MMHRDSCACGTDSLELFKVPSTNITLEDSKWMEYYPISSTLNSDTAPIEFEIKGQGDEYLDLSQSGFRMEDGPTGQALFMVSADVAEFCSRFAH